MKYICTFLIIIKYFQILLFAKEYDYSAKSELLLHG